MRTVVETPTFSRQADKLFSEDDKRELIDLLAASPMAGVEIPVTGGVRKLRFAAAGHGKRGGAEGDEMSTFGDDLNQSLKEAVAHAKGEGPGVVHVPVSPRTIRKQAKLT